MTKLTFLFMSRGAASQGSTPDNWKADKECGNHYNVAFYKEGYFRLLEELLKMGVIDRLNIFYESNRNPGIAKWVEHPNAYCAVIPEIRFAEQYIDEDTILWIRGGFKQWLGWLYEKYKGKNWMLMYPANTGRERWEHWDIILDDIATRFLEPDKFGRITFPFIKPIDTDFYKPIDMKMKYDVCIGNSHVHDKKGQWRVVKAIEEYEKKFRKPLNVVLPGAVFRGEQTNKMMKKINKNHGALITKRGKLKSKFTLTGHVDKTELVNILNQSKIAVFLGAHGQNDRGPLEALACGCRIILGFPNYHTNLLENFPGFCVTNVSGNEDNYRAISSTLLSCLLIDSHTIHYKNMVSSEYKKHLSFEKSINQMRWLIETTKNTKPTIKNKNKLVRVIGYEGTY